MQVNESSVQRLVETPYIYMLARSSATVKDQLLYVPTRLEDLHQLSNTVRGPNGIDYKDRLRFFSGKFQWHVDIRLNYSLIRPMCLSVSLVHKPVKKWVDCTHFRGYIK